MSCFVTDAPVQRTTDELSVPSLPSSTSSSSASLLLQSLHSQRMHRQRQQPLLRSFSLLVPCCCGRTPRSSTTVASWEYRKYTYKTWPGDTIGSIVWDGTLALLAYIEYTRYTPQRSKDEKDERDGKMVVSSSHPKVLSSGLSAVTTIVELGSGIGLLSIGYSMLYCTPSESPSPLTRNTTIYVTDQKQVIPLLTENIEDYRTYCRRNHYPLPSLHVLPLSWGSELSFDPLSTESSSSSSSVHPVASQSIDLVLAADVIYEPVSTKLFVETLHSLIPVPSSSSPSSSYCIMAYKERGIGPYFFTLLKDSLFSYEDITPSMISSLSTLHHQLTTTTTSSQSSASTPSNTNRNHESSIRVLPSNSLSVSSDAVDVAMNSFIPWPYTEHRIYRITR